MNPDDARELMASIDSDRLVVLCGAGLSTSPPSRVPLARELAQYCAQQCRLRTGVKVPAEIEQDLERLAEFFLASAALRVDFREHFVDWSRFRGEPNEGHLAIADFLGCGVIEGVLTANFDTLIEKAAERLGEPDFHSTVDRGEITHQYEHRPLLKLHGCMSRNRDRLLWCRSQVQGNGPLRDQDLVLKLEEWGASLRASLRGHHLLIIGFWTDWSYLNSVVEAVIGGIEPSFVCLVDPEPEEELQQKAPGLWDLATRDRVRLLHIRGSGAEFLAELRRWFGLNFFERLLTESVESYKALGGSAEKPAMKLPEESDADQLYDLRRDVCGVPGGKIVRDKRPRADMQAVGAIHLLLQAKGAKFEGPAYITAQKQRIRVVNGAGRVLSLVKAEFSHGQPQTVSSEVVICVAQDDGNVPTHIVRGGTPPTVVRSGSDAEWITFQTARARSIC